jgi:hypothetical protein
LTASNGTAEAMPCYKALGLVDARWDRQEIRGEM